MFKIKLKKSLWLAARFCVLGPLAVLAILGEYAEDLFIMLDEHMPSGD